MFIHAYTPGCTLPHYIILYPTVQSYYTPMHSTGQYCTYPLTSILPHYTVCWPNGSHCTPQSTDKHCMVLFPTVPIFITHVVIMYTNELNIKFCCKYIYLRPKSAWICFESFLLHTRKRMGFYFYEFIMTRGFRNSIQGSGYEGYQCFREEGV